MTNRTAPADKACLRKMTLCAGLLLGLCTSLTARAVTDNRWLLCGPALSPPAETEPFDPSAPLEFSADRALFDRGGISRLSGEVEFRQDGRTLSAEEALYDDRQGIVEAQGGVHYRDSALEVEGERARLWLRSDTGSFEQARYRLPQQHAHGTAQRVAKINENITRLQRVRYTTCNPGRIDWQLRAREIRLDRHRRMGSAKGVSVHFKRVPIFYFPYLVFPITDERLSGFLMPDIRLNLSRNSTDIALPYYWNIAPNYDATITPRFIERRGVMLGSEFRYLTPSSSGQLYGEYLGDDRLYGRDRALLRFQHHSRLSPHWSGSVNYNYVSDRDYFVDMGDSFNPNTTTHQERRFTLNYRGDRWAFAGTLLGYQMLIGTTPPYQKLPQLTLQYIGRQRERELNYHFRSEYTYFDDNARTPTGSRLDVAPAVSFPLRTTATWLIPRLTLHHTRYRLDATPPGMPSAPSRTLPLFSLDGGLFLERFTEWGNVAMVQTLEPRLFYLYVPYREQSKLPLFDTSAYTFRADPLFSGSAGHARCRRRCRDEQHLRSGRGTGRSLPQSLVRGQLPDLGSRKRTQPPLFRPPPVQTGWTPPLHHRLPPPVRSGTKQLPLQAARSLRRLGGESQLVSARALELRSGWGTDPRDPHRLRLRQLLLEYPAGESRIPARQRGGTRPGHLCQPGAEGALQYQWQTNRCPAERWYPRI